MPSNVKLDKNRLGAIYSSIDLVKLDNHKYLMCKLWFHVETFSLLTFARYEESYPNRSSVACISIIKM